MFAYEILSELGLVSRLDSSIFGARTERSALQMLFLTRMGISLIDSIIGTFFSACDVLCHSGSMIMKAKRRLRVCMRRSTIPVILWSCVGENINLIFFVFTEYFKGFSIKGLRFVAAYSAWYSVNFAIGF